MTKYTKLATKVGKLVDEKNKAYGDSFHDADAFLTLLYPDGIPREKYADMLCIVRIFDKLKRIATKKKAFGESPYQDIVGYALLGLQGDNNQQEYKEMLLRDFGIDEIDESVDEDVEDLAEGNEDDGEDSGAIQVATPYEEYKEDILRRNSTIPAAPSETSQSPTTHTEATLVSTNVADEVELVRGVPCVFCKKEILPGVPKNVLGEGVTVAHPECFRESENLPPAAKKS